MRPPKICTIYCITNTILNKNYIGATCVDIKVRYGVHCSMARKGSKTLLHVDMREYGFSNFQIKELDKIEINSMFAPNFYERKWIKTLNSGAPLGYNMNNFKSMLCGSYEYSRYILDRFRRDRGSIKRFFREMGINPHRFVECLHRQSSFSNFELAKINSALGTCFEILNLEIKTPENV